MMKRVIYPAATAGALLGLILLTPISTTWVAGMLEKRYPPPGQMVPVGNYKLQLYCSGSGSPTVVIEPGMGVDWVGWRGVIASLLPSNRVCVYDRAGYGWSDPGPKPRTALLETRELHTMLTRAGVPQPYILAAHSFGAYIARIYASQFRDSLAGVVLVDPSSEEEPIVDMTKIMGRGWRMRDLLDLIPPLGIQRLRRMYNGENALPRDLRSAPRFYQERYLIASSLAQLKYERNEFDSLSLTRAQVRATVFPRDLPLIVITAVRPADVHASSGPTGQELQARLAHLSASGRQIFARRSGHMIPVDEPELIVGAVQELTRQSSRRTEAALP